MSTACDAGDAAAVDLGDRHGHAEGDLGQDGQLVGGVGAVHVERRVGLGVAPPLGLGQRFAIGLARLLGHGGEDEVAGAVEDALQRQDLVGGQALGQRGDDRHAAGDAGLEGDGPLVLAGRLEDLGAVLGQQRLVGGDDVLARRQQVEHDLPGPVDAADQLDADLNRSGPSAQLGSRW